MSVIVNGCTFLLVFFTCCNGMPRFANYFQDNMVLQRAPKRAVIWGFGDPGVVTTLEMNDQIYRTISQSTPANELGESIWSVTLDPIPGPGPIGISVQQPLKNGTIVTIQIKGVLFGDVWLCSGQSNMQMTVSQIYNGSDEIANADRFPNIRVFTAALQPSDTPVEELIGIELAWSQPTTRSIGGEDWDYMSAVCWLFGRMVHQALNVPIGLIATSWGGTPIEFWMPPVALQECNISTTEKTTIQPYNENTTPVTLSNSNLYNAMIYPFTRMVIYGIIWYQGESNADYHADKYGCSFSKLISHWRQTWNVRTSGITDTQLPFGFVQLATYTSDTTKVGGFPVIRWHQTYDQGYVPNPYFQNVFMAVACDLRDDPNGIHPRYKHDVAYRLSRAALGVAYNTPSIEYLGPIPKAINYESGYPTVNIVYGSVSNIDQRSSNGFDICCRGVDCLNDTAWVPTTIANRSNLTVAVSVPDSCKGSQLYGIRYLWRETPCPFKQAAIYSDTDRNLPAPPYFARLVK